MRISAIAAVFIMVFANLQLHAQTPIQQFSSPQRRAVKAFSIEPASSFARTAPVNWKKQLGLSVNSTIVELKNSSKTNESRKVLQQYHLNYLVEGAVYFIHYKKGVPVYANGEFWKVMPNEANIAISEEEANQTARRAVASKLAYLKPNYNKSRATQLLYTPVRNKQGQITDHRLAYKVDVYQQKPVARYWVYIDAETGKVINKISQIHENEENGTAQTRYSGEQKISTSAVNGGYELLSSGADGEIITLNCQQGTDKGNAVAFFDEDNIWDETTNFDDAAYDAHWGALKTLQFFKSNFNRSSYDDNGAPLYVFVHFDSYYDNAFWDGQSLTFGDGSNQHGGFSPLTALDVVAHEFGHGVTEYSAGLVYAYESGALNESFSDIFGAAVEAEVKPNTVNNFLVGEEIRIGGGALRSMSNPNTFNDPDTYGGNYYYTGDEDGGGVHTNSGVQNFWFYLLSQGGNGTNDLGNNFEVQAIGIEKATAIAYRNLTTYLTPNSTYADAAFFALKSAQDLYGTCSNEAIQTANAWYAVGVSDEPSFTTEADFSASVTSACTLDKEIQFTNLSQWAGSYEWNFGDGTTSTLQNPTHTYTSPGTYTVSLTAYPANECGSTQQTKTLGNYITVENGGGPRAVSCTPQLLNTCCNVGIKSFNFAGINSTVHNSEVGYTDLSCQHNTNNIIYRGDRAVFSAEMGFPEGERFWMYIDWNNNGSFEASELVYSENALLASHTGVFEVPASTIINTPLRVRIRSTAADWLYPDACADIEYGEVQDFSVTVKETSAQAPVADFILPSGIYLNETVQFTDASSGGVSSWYWTFEGANISSSSQRDPVVNFYTPGQKQVTLTVSNTSGTRQITKYVNVEEVNSLTMCQASSSSRLSGILYDSGGENGSYSNYEDCSFLLAPTGLAACGEVAITVTKFGIEKYYDRLRIYDGSNENGVLLYNSDDYSGTTNLTAQSGQFYATWHSDESITDRGFSIAWQVNSTSQGDLLVDYKTNTTNPAFGEAVEFTSEAENYSWLLWNFGDGSTSSAENPVHNYNSPGNYTVTLTARSCTGQEKSVQKNITVQEAGQIKLDRTEFTYRLKTGTQYTDAFTLGNTGNGELVWNLSNIRGNTGKILLYAYDSPYWSYEHIADSLYQWYGSDNVVLSYADNAATLQNELEQTSIMVVPYQESTLSYTDLLVVREWVNQGGKLILWGNFDIPSYGFFDIKDINIDFNSQTQLNIVNPNHEYLNNTPANYTVDNYYVLIYELEGENPERIIQHEYIGKTWDVLCRKDVGTGSVVLSGFVPITEAMAPGYTYQILKNVIDIEASTSTKQGVGNWLTLDTTSGRTAGNSAQNIGVTLNPGQLEVGTYQQQVTINSNDGTTPKCTLNFTLHVTEEVIQDFNYMVLDTCATSQIKFINTSTMANNSRFEWDFGDGTSSNEDSPTHLYAKPGTYRVNLKAMEGNSVLGEVNKEAKPLHLMAEPTMPEQVHIGYAMEYFANLAGEYTNVFWNFGDGYMATIADPVHTYFTEGNYTLSFSATNEYGCSVYYEQAVEVGNFPALGLEELSSSAWKMYPNPSNGAINLSLPGGKWSLKVVSTHGQVVTTKEIQSTGLVLPVTLDAVPKGLYVIYLSNGKQQAVKKLLLN